MKKVLVLLITLSMLGGVASCSEYSGVEYDIDFGVKAEELSDSELEYYDDHVQKAINNIKLAYAQAVNADTKLYGEKGYLFLDNLIVLDFKNVDASKLDEDQKLLWDAMKRAGGNARPLMYVYFDGYVEYFDDGIVSQISESAILSGCMVYDGGSYQLKKFSYYWNSTFEYDIPDGKKVINFGDMYSLTYEPAPEKGTK